MATINGVEVIGDKNAHDYDLLDKDDGINLANGIERNRKATKDNHEDIVRHRTDTDVHVTPEWKNSLVTKEILGLYWTAAQTADIINEISIAGGAKLVKVEVLPETGLEQTIYLVPKTDPQAGDVFDEFVWVDGKYEFIGTTKVDLSNYATKTELNAKQDALSAQQLSNIADVVNKANASDLTAHTNNADIHVTPSDKANWNAKQDALTNQQLSNIADVANKANDADVVHKSGDTMSGDLLGNGSNNLGTSSNKWKTINGINPGALSLPSTSYVNIDTTDWVLDGVTVNQLPTSSGSYAYLSLMTEGDDDGFIEISWGGYPNGHAYIHSKSVKGYCGIFVPVFNLNKYESICIKANRIRYARWYPLQGNV